MGKGNAVSTGILFGSATATEEILLRKNSRIIDVQVDIDHSERKARLGTLDGVNAAAQADGHSGASGHDVTERRSAEVGYMV